MSRIFEIVQAMSGQKNCIVIPRPYLSYFAGDQQVFALAAVLNQLVFWSGKSTQENDWFYKSHDELGKEVGGMSEDQIRRVVEKLSRKYLPDAVEVTTRKVNGTPVKHYRINGDALIAKIFPSSLETADSPNGKREGEVSKPQKCGKETAEVPNESGEVAESYLYPDHYTDHHIQITKPLLSENSGESPDAKSNIDFLSLHPDAVTYNATSRKWGTQKDLDCATWLAGKIEALFKSIGAKPSKQPNWTDWSNDVRLMREIDGHSHREICEKYLSVLADSFWRKNVLSPNKLREKWDELTLRLANPDQVNNTERDEAYLRYMKRTKFEDRAPKSDLEIMVRKGASSADIGMKREEFAKAAWNKIWAECSQRQAGEKAA